MSSRGGKSKAYNALDSVDPLSKIPGVSDLNLETAEGLRTYLAHALRALGNLSFDVRVANSIGQLVTAQRTVVVAGDFEERLAALEAALHLRKLQAV